MGCRPMCLNVNNHPHQTTRGEKRLPPSAGVGGFRRIILMKLKAILFDLDDTLIDWGDFNEDWVTIEMPHIQKVYAYLSAQGWLDCGFEAYQEAYFAATKKAWTDARTSLIAPHLGRVLVAVAESLGVPAGAVTVETMLECYDWDIILGTTAFPEVIPVLERLRKTSLQLGIVTNAFAPMALRDVELGNHDLRDFFPKCRISAADNGYLKPHPHIFESALACLGTRADETIFIGDNPTADIAGAQAVGMRAILRVTGKARPLISGLVIPDAAINTLEELPAILDTWYDGWETAHE